MWRAPVMLAALLWTACSSDQSDAARRAADAASDAQPGDAGSYPDQCENISGVHCLLPFPSSRFLVADAGTASGKRVALPALAMPADTAGRSIDPAMFNRFDGFSPATSIITAVTGGDIDEASLVDESHIADSLLDSSPTLLFEVRGTSLTRVAHFAEIDHFSRADPERRPLFIRPAARLAPGSRYVVAIRRLRHPDGTSVEPGAYFRALRSGEALAEAPDLEARRPAFEELFALLTAAGAERGELIQAWDFWTASDESLTSDLLSVRDQGLSALSALGTSCTVTDTREGPAPTEQGGTGDARVFRRIHGTVRVPLFLHGVSPEVDAECLLERDASGRVVQNPTTPTADVPFTISIPTSVRDSLMAGGAPARLVEYGHGLSSNQKESEAEWLGAFADERQLVVAAVDWWGIASDDTARLSATNSDASRLPTITERSAQGILNFLVMMRSLIVAGACRDLPELRVNGVLAYDPAERYFHGNSGGGILGTTLTAVSTDTERSAVGVAGGGFALLIPRSIAGVPFLQSMFDAYRRDALVTSLNWVMSQAVWDTIDPITYAPHLRAQPLPCPLPECAGGVTPTHRIAYQIGRHDVLVPNLASAFAARSLRTAAGDALPLLSDAAHVSPYLPYGLPTSSGPEDSALTVFLTPGVAPVAIGARPAAPFNDVHERVRRAPAAQEQIDRFFRPGGRVEQVCPGTCEAPE